MFTNKQFPISCNVFFLYVQLSSKNVGSFSNGLITKDVVYYLAFIIISMKCLNYYFNLNILKS